MKILLAHKFYRMTGGTEVYFRDLTKILESHGHTTIPFALKHPENPPTPYERYFLDDLDYRRNSRLYFLAQLPRILGRTLYSFEARRKVEQLIRDTAPDLVHLQSIEHHISPSILHSFRKYHLPMVMSVNTYKLVCASYRLYLFDRNQICERCLYGKHYHAVATRCVKGSLFGSVLGCVEMYLHAGLRLYHLIDRFIVPNQFMARQLVGAGFPSEKVIQLLNPLQLDEYQPSYAFDDYILYFGRIDPEKGVLSLVKAMEQIPAMRLVVVGSGSQLPEIRDYVEQRQIRNVELVGPKWDAQLTPLLARARAVVVPSIWNEPSPMVIYQALATGKPVIGARIGGIPDLITPETGALYESGNADELAAALQHYAVEDTWVSKASLAARRWAEENLDSERYYERIYRLYCEIIEEKRG